MTKRFPARGYVRAVLLSLLAAFLIEVMINTDDVRAAFAAGGKIIHAIGGSGATGTAGHVSAPSVLFRALDTVRTALFF